MTYLQEHKKRDSADSLYGAMKRNVRHILGISVGKDSSTLFIGNPCRSSRRQTTVTSWQSVFSFPSLPLLRGFFLPTLFPTV